MPKKMKWLSLLPKKVARHHRQESHCLVEEGYREEHQQYRPQKTLYNMDPVKKRNVHDHMGHLEPTAHKYYMTQRKTKVAVESHKTIVKNLQIEEQEEEVKEPESVEPNKADPKSPDSENQDSPNKIVFNDTELQDIDLIFSEHIATNAKLTHSEVKKVMSECFSLMVLSKNPVAVRKVADRVRYLQKRDALENLSRVETETPEQKVEDWITTHSSQASTLSVKSRGRKWSERDEELIIMACRKYDKVPSKDEIRSMFLTDDALQEDRRPKKQKGKETKSSCWTEVCHMQKIEDRSKTSCSISRKERSHRPKRVRKVVHCNM